MIRRPPRSTLSLHDALPISTPDDDVIRVEDLEIRPGQYLALAKGRALALSVRELALLAALGRRHGRVVPRDRKSTRLNSSHANISYAVFCLKKKQNLLDLDY